jgi:protease secretion system outer membrane protein
MNGRASSRVLLTVLTLAGLLLLAPASRAASLLQDFLRAQAHDPVYAGALAENDIGRLQARMASFAYFPEGRISSTQLDNESGSRVTFALNQPLLSYDRWLMLKEVDPRLALAAARLEQSQNELAGRLLKAVGDWAEAREQLKLNRANIEALATQAQSARRSFELGMGTITDVRDTEVRLAQARSQSFTLDAALGAARRQYAALVGDPGPADGYVLTDALPAAALPPLAELLAQASDRNAAIRAGVQSAVVAEVGVRRARAALYPTVTFAAQRSQISGRDSISSSGVALRLEMPLAAGTYFRTATAAVELRRVEEQVRTQKQQVSLEVERLYGEVRAAESELAVRREAIRAAELSLDANEQSFKGGFRSRVDVLNALQSVFQAKADYSSALLRLGEGWAQLRLLAAYDIESTLKQLETFVFRR